MTEIKYTNTHEWIKLHNGAYRIGVSNYAQSALGDVVYIAEAAVGKKVKKGQQITAIDSVKISAELYAPVSGTITSFNSLLSSQPELVNNDPLGDGWMVTIEPDNMEDFTDLLSEDQYNVITADH